MRFLGVLLTALALAPVAEARPLKLIALADMPYGPPETPQAAYQALLSDINAARPDLVLHLGDLKGGSTPCSDEVFARERANLMRIAAPVLFAPGDNDWVDCHRDKAGRHDPFERLEALRETFFTPRGLTLGAPIKVAQDPPRPEQGRLKADAAVIATLHVTGSDNGAGLWTLWSSRGHQARADAAIDWMRRAFEEARDGRPVVIAMHADIFRKRDFKPNKREWREESVFHEIGDALAASAAAHDGPVLLLYGDGHEYIVHRPLPDRAPNLLAVEVFGHPDLDAVAVTIDPDADEPFAVAPLRGGR